MAIVLKNELSDATGLTITENGSTVVVSGNKVICTLTSTLGWSGFIATATRTIVAGDRFYYSYKKTVINTIFANMGNTTGTLGSDPTNINGWRANSITSQAVRIEGGASTGGPGALTFTLGTRYFGLIHYEAANISVYANTTGHSEDVGDYTLNGDKSGSNDVGVVQKVHYGQFDGVGLIMEIYPWAFTDANGLPPPILTDLATGTATESTIPLTWTDAGDATSQTGTSIERSTTGGGVGFSEIAEVPFNTETYNDSNLSALTEYFYRARSYVLFDGVKYYSAYTSEVSETTTAIPIRFSYIPDPDNLSGTGFTYII